MKNIQRFTLFHLLSTVRLHISALSLSALRLGRPHQQAHFKCLSLKSNTTSVMQILKEELSLRIFAWQEILNDMPEIHLSSNQNVPGPSDLVQAC